MAAELYIPKLGQTVEEVTLVRWRVKDGEKVERGQEVLEVETDKAVFDVEATADGFIHLGPYQEGDLVPEAPKSTESQSKTEAKIAMPIRSDSGDKVFASPRSRQLAAANGVNLSEVEPTGGNGVRITEADVLRYLAKAANTTPVAERREGG
jgi:pyruvate/2-oxoglutarate dehydrogenase complex dihydrolipoamide acyltransferase (E2) component